MSLVEQEHRSRAVDVERGGADRRRCCFPCSRPASYGPSPHGADAIRSPWIVRAEPVGARGSRRSASAQRQRAIRRLGASRRCRE